MIFFCIYSCRLSLFWQATASKYKVFQTYNFSISILSNSGVINNALSNTWTLFFCVFLLFILFSVFLNAFYTSLSGWMVLKKPIVPFHIVRNGRSVGIRVEMIATLGFFAAPMMHKFIALHSAGAAPTPGNGFTNVERLRMMRPLWYLITDRWHRACPLWL